MNESDSRASEPSIDRGDPGERPAAFLRAAQVAVAVVEYAAKRGLIGDGSHTVNLPDGDVGAIIFVRKETK